MNVSFSSGTPPSAYSPSWLCWHRLDTLHWNFPRTDCDPEVKEFGRLILSGKNCRQHVTSEQGASMLGSQTSRECHVVYACAVWQLSSCSICESVMSLADFQTEEVFILESLATDSAEISLFHGSMEHLRNLENEYLTTTTSRELAHLLFLPGFIDTSSTNTGMNVQTSRKKHNW